MSPKFAPTLGPRVSSFIQRHRNFDTDGDPETIVGHCDFRSCHLHVATMKSMELAEALEELGLDDNDAGQLLGMSGRSVRRWREGEAVPGAVEAAVRAWLTLHRNALPWKPDSLSVLVNDRVQIQRMREHAEILHLLLEEVDREGGPKTHWNVDFAP